jgi:predicted transcriptional regulator
MRNHLRAELTRLKEEIAEFRTRYRRYVAPDLKRRAGRLAAKLEAQGWLLDGVAEELGVTLVTLRRWRDGASEAGAALVPVEVEPRAEQSSGLVLVSPSGWRVENLDLHTAVDLLREVGS